MLIKSYDIIIIFCTYKRSLGCFNILITYGLSLSVSVIFTVNSWYNEFWYNEFHNITNLWCDTDYSILKKILLYRIILIKWYITLYEENFLNIIYKMTLIIMNYSYNEYFFWHSEGIFFKDKLIYYKDNLIFVLFLNVVIYIFLILSQLIKMGFRISWSYFIFYFTFFFTLVFFKMPKTKSTPTTKK